MVKKILIVAFIFSTIFCCDNNELDKNKHKGKELYTIVCKHPMGHVLRFTLDKNNWDHANNYRNSIWRFKTISGLKVALSGPCYTDSDMKIVK